MASDIDRAFSEVVGSQGGDSRKEWSKYGGYILFYRIRRFFLGEKPPKKNTTKFSDLAETILSSFPENPSVELLNAGDKLLQQQRMLEDTLARKRLERWATRVIGWYLLLVLILVLLNGVVLIYHPIETSEVFSKSGVFMKRGFISDTIMTIILSTTTINIIGLGLIVLKGHFGNRKVKDKRKS